MMFAVVMIALNGLVGLSLLLGGLRHHAQVYNLQGTSAYLNTIMALAVLGLVLPNYTSFTFRSAIIDRARGLSRDHLDCPLRRLSFAASYTA